MTYGSNAEGIGTLTLSHAENEQLRRGEAITKRSGDCRGHFKIVVKLTRPLKKADRFIGM